MKKHTMKKSIVKISVNIICIMTLLLLVLALSSCNEETLHSYSLVANGTDEGVGLDGETIVMNLGQRVAVSCGRIIQKADGVGDNYEYVALEKNGDVLDITPSAAATYKITITYDNGSTSNLAVIVRNANCAGCEKDFNTLANYNGHKAPCGHNCIHTSGGAHNYCGYCKQYMCNTSIADHSVVAGCGITGHMACSGNHSILDCPDGHLGCNTEYGAQECGHCMCEGEHFTCPVCDEFNCANFDIPHEKYYCGHILCNETMQYGHEECTFCGDCITYGTHSESGCVPPEEE